MSERTEQSLETRLRTALDQLAVIGARMAELTYDDVGDSGHVEELRAFGAEGPITLPEPLQSRLDDLAFRVLQWKKPGWELNEGSFGIVRFYVDERAVEVDHVWRREEGDSDWIELEQGDLFDGQADAFCGLQGGALPLA
jgi:hypothetical protein